MKTPRILTTIALLIAPLAVRAVNDTWDGGGADNNIATNLNWADNTAPASDVANTDLFFQGAVRLTPNFSAVFAAHSLTFNNTAGANPFTFTGTTFVIGSGGIVNNDGDTETFGNAISLGAGAVSFNAASAGLTFANSVNIGSNALSLDGAGAFAFNNIVGQGTVNKTGAGTMTWSPNSVENFGFTIGAGTVTTVADGSTDTFNTTGSFAVNGTSILNLNENTVFDGVLLTRASGADFNVAAGKTLTIQNGADVTTTGIFTHNAAANVIVAGVGSTFTTTSTMNLNSGSTTTVQAGGSVSSGTGAMSIGTSGNGTVTVDGSASTIGGGTLNVGLNGATGNLTLSTSSTGSFTTINVDNSGSVGTSGTLNIQSGASVSGSSLLVATAAASNTANITITGTNSALTITGATTIGATSASTANFNVQSGGTFNSGTSTITVNATGSVDITGGTFNANGNMTLNGQLMRDASGVFTLAQGKTLTIQSGGDAIFAGSYDTGATTTNGGNITVAGAGSTLQASAGLRVISGSTVSVNTNGTISSTTFLDVGTNGAGTLTVDGAGSSASGSAFSQWGNSAGAAANVTFSTNATGTFSGGLAIGATSVNGASAIVQVLTGADVSSTSSLSIGTGIGVSSGSLTVDGTGSTWGIGGAGAIGVGSANSTGTLTVSNSGLFTTGTGTTTIGALGTLAINGGQFQASGSVVVNGGQFTRSSTGIFSLALGKTLTVQAGGDATFTGNLALNSASSVTVTGAGSTFGVSSQLTMFNGISLNVQSGGTASANSLAAGSGASTDSIVVTGAGSSLTAGITALGNATAQFTLGSTASLGTVLVDPPSFGVVGGTGSLLVHSGAQVTASSTGIASTNIAFGGSGTITVTGVGSSYTQTGNFFLNVGNSTGGGATATLNVQTGGTYTSGTGIVSLNASGAINIDGGTLTLNGALSRNGGALNFNTGALSIVDNFVVGTGGLFGTDVTFDTTRRFTTTASTTIDAFHTLTLNGATFSTGSLANNGTLAFNSGTLAITGAGGFNIGTGALGANVTLGTGSNLQVTNTTFVASGALLRVNGGGFSSGGILNDGTIDHANGTMNFTSTFTNNAAGRLFVGGLASPAGSITNAGRITMQNGIGFLGGAGAITNTGLITGDGTIAKPVTNSAAGQLRAEAGKTLTFTGAIAANAGTFSLQGGTLEFTSAITNSATGFISGRGSLITTGITNQGVMAFSGGTADVYGDVTNSAGARIVTSGAGSVTTFYDDVVHNGLEIFTGANASTVFFGAQSGAGSFTGTGTVYFIGDLRPGNSPASVRYGGDVAFGGTSSLSLEIGGLLAGTEYDRLNVAGTLFEDGALDVSLYGGFTPHFGDSFDLFDAGAIIGAFDTVNLPDLAGDLEWDATNLPTTGQIRVVPEPGIGALVASALALFGLHSGRRRKHDAANTPS